MHWREAVDEKDCECRELVRTSEAEEQEGTASVK